MNKAKDVVDIAERECKAHGVPITAKRVNVFAMLLLSNKAVSAYEIADSYTHFFNEPVPVITVYRVLDFLQSKHLVHKLDTANKFIACNHLDCEHKHPASQFLICKECSEVKELSLSQSKFDELKQTIEQAGFHLNKPQLEMNCICNKCYNATQ